MRKPVIGLFDKIGMQIYVGDVLYFPPPYGGMYLTVMEHEGYIVGAYRENGELKPNCQLLTGPDLAEIIKNGAEVVETTL